MLAETARRHPHGEALVSLADGVRLTWSGLDAEATTLAAGLLRLGLEPGDRVGILAPNLAPWVMLQFAVARAGLVLVNLNPAYRVAELRHALASTGCRALATVERFKTSDYPGMLGEVISSDRDVAENIRWPILLDGAAEGFIGLDEVRGGADAAGLRGVEAVAREQGFDDAVNIQFTSGTTGKPKAATLSHHNIVNNARLSADIMRLTERDRLCIPVPLYHCFGMVLGTLLCATCGATMVLPGAGFDAVATLDAVEGERCTALHGVPTMFIAALDSTGFGRRELGSLRTGIMAGAPCPEELMRRVMVAMHLDDITIAYGMTETGPLSTQTRIGDPAMLRVETVGRVLPHTEIKIVDAGGRVVPVGVTGELCTRGHGVMLGYWGDQRRTREEIDVCGWIRSGDLASMDADGNVRIVGRLKDMLIRGGENIYPREIEECLYRHPAVEQVEVFGVSDPRLGEEVAAWIRRRPGMQCDAGEIRDFCRERIAHFKVPRHIRFVEEFPMTVTGKVQKFAMRESMERELADGEKVDDDS